MGNKKSIPRNYLSEKDLILIEENTNLNLEEIVEWHGKYLLDCPNGRLDKKCFIKLYKELLPKDLNVDKYAAFVFEALDSDNSGYIEFTEFLLAFSLRAHGNIDERLKWTFSMYDQDGNGYIEKKELKQMLSLLYKMLNINKKEEKYNLDKRIETIMKKYDTSGDRRLSCDEFINGVKNDEILRGLLLEHKLE